MAYDPRPPIYLYESLALLLGVQGTTCPDRLVSVSPYRVANFGGIDRGWQEEKREKLLN